MARICSSSARSCVLWRMSRGGFWVEFGWGVTNVSRATTTMRIGVIAVWAHHVTMRRVLSLQDVCLLMT